MSLVRPSPKPSQTLFLERPFLNEDDLVDAIPGSDSKLDLRQSLPLFPGKIEPPIDMFACWGSHLRHRPCSSMLAGPSC